MALRSGSDGTAGSSGGGKGNNFLTSPTGQKSGGPGGQPTSFMKSRPQEKGVDLDTQNDEVPGGGKIPFADCKGDEGNPVGVGSVGNAAKPYKLSGA